MSSINEPNDDPADSPMIPEQNEPASDDVKYKDSRDQHCNESVGQILGYLNFSAGTEDPKFFSAMSDFFSRRWNAERKEIPNWLAGLEILQTELGKAGQSNSTFRDCHQASAVLEFAANRFLPEYRQHHEILLGHHEDDELFTPFFLARWFQTALTSYTHQEDSLPSGRFDFEAIRKRFDDYLGFRPVAVLESRTIEPYPHEWTRPIPIYITGVGAADGKYKPFVDHAIRMISNAPANILNAAQFDLESLDEMAIDPRAYDFDHPANKRPNYHFGQWDPHQLDLSGYFRRFIVQQVTLDSLAVRCEGDPYLKPELVFEAGAVLAGTILMATSVCGRGPDSFDSNTSIASLLPQIARMRDQFYDWLLSTVEGIHGENLRKEAKENRQPFGGARQHLNAELANLRETQLEKVRLAGIYARMGYSNAANELSNSVQVASARIRTKIESKLTESNQAIAKAEYSQSAEDLAETTRLIHQGIQCGALIDPWNILGFDAQFSLFPAMENSVLDERAHYLVEMMTQIFESYSALWCHAATQDEKKVCEQIQEEFRKTSDWWHQFAAHEVSNVEATDSVEVFKAAEHVAQAMNLWQKEGGETGNVAFWSKHAHLFATPRSYELIVNALFDKNDLSTSMALLMHWLGQAETVGLESPESSFHLIVEQWTFKICEQTLQDYRFGRADETLQNLHMLGKFMDFLEVNAESYWQIPEFELGDKSKQQTQAESDDVIQDGPDEIYGAAYEDVVYRDSTDDGMAGQIFETDDHKSDQLETEARRLEERLQFHETVAKIWQMLAPVFAECATKFESEVHSEFGAAIKLWAKVAQDRVGALHQLLFSVESMKPTMGLGDHESMVEYDRQRYIQEGLMERIIMVTVSTRHSMRMLNAAQMAISKAPIGNGLDSMEVLMSDIFVAIFQNNRELLVDQMSLFAEEIKRQPLLYVPISRNGVPSKIELVKSRQLFIRKLLEILPRFGLIEQTFRLLNTARAMERSHPVGNGAVTEFDDLFEIGFRAVVDSFMNSASHDDSTADQHQLLFRWLERFTESSLIVWLKHSRTLRLSVLEKTHDKDPWREVVMFIRNYGKDLFTQRFLNFANIRGILHQGVESWLDGLMENDQSEMALVADLDNKITREQAGSNLSLILEAILENHLEYQDYNSTTTQSDQGDLLYMLIDFLRLKVGYDRISWHLKPVFWAHENLVNGGMEQVAKRWRRSLIDRINKKAIRFVSNLERLQRRYAMRMPTVASRIKEKFVKPMSIDRMKALVRPAMDPRNPDASSSFELLQRDVALLLEKPEGSGIKVPSWLAAIEDEVAETLDNSVTDEKILNLFSQPSIPARDAVREQLNTISDLTTHRRRNREQS